MSIDTHSSPQSKSEPVVKDGSDLDTTLTIYKTMASTSARIFVPPLGLTALGYGIDKIAHTRPVIMFIGMAIGCVLAVWLVARQYKTVTQSTNAEK